MKIMQMLSEYLNMKLGTGLDSGDADVHSFRRLLQPNGCWSARKWQHIPTQKSYIDTTNHCAIDISGPCETVPTGFIYSSKNEQKSISAEMKRELGGMSQKQIYAFDQGSVLCNAVEENYHTGVGVRIRQWEYLGGIQVRDVENNITKEALKNLIEHERAFREQLDYYKNGMHPMKVVFASDSQRDLIEIVLGESGFSER